MIIAGGVLEKYFNQYTINSKKVNEQVLFKILNKNKKCKYGKEYKFNSIKSINEYKSKVPITNYASYEKYIEENCKNCKNKDKDLCEIRISVFNDIITTKCVYYERED